VKGRVLIIDDEPEIRRNLTIGLTQADYEVVACTDGISAIHELDRSRSKGAGFDYLVTDIFMPDIDGLKILKVIRSLYPELPVVVITGFGDERLKETVLAQKNTAYLDKPFEISELVAVLERLVPGATTLASSADPASAGPASESRAGARPAAAGGDAAGRDGAGRDGAGGDGAGGDAAGSAQGSLSVYLMLRISDEARSLEIFHELRRLEGVESCDAVRGDVDVILRARVGGSADMQRLFEQARAIPGIAVVSQSTVERPELDRDVEEFIRVYQQAVKQDPGAAADPQPGTTSYVIVDIDKDAVQPIFTTMLFIDEVIFCDLIENGSKLVGMIRGRDAVGRTPRIIEKIAQIEGVLRVREAKVIQIFDDD